VRPLDADLWDWVDRQPSHPSHRPLLPARASRRALTGICGWELVALLTGLLPPITALVHARQKSLAVRSVVVVALAVLGHHLLIESPQTKGTP
jgi:hypothetical protein